MGSRSSQTPHSWRLYRIRKLRGQIRRRQKELNKLLRGIGRRR